MPDAPIHAVVPTHTPRYLDLVLVGLARQTRRADAIIVSSDGDDPAIGETIAHWARRLDLTVHWIRRGRHGEERLSQARNNAVRHLVDALGVRAGRIVVLDGDMVASDDLLAGHELLGRRADLVYPFRVNLSRELSESLDAERLLAGTQRLEPTPKQRAELGRRHRRYQRHLLLRRLRLGPLHKPKLLGGHFSVSLEWWLRLNGFDELYQGWGFKDDEFARRAARAGATCAVAVRDIVAYHLWHESRQPAGPMRKNPNYLRFRRRDLPIVCEHGVRNPIPQHPVVATCFGNPRPPAVSAAHAGAATACP